MSDSIVHVFPDSPFLSFVADVFESVAPGRNTFLVYSPKDTDSRFAVPAGAAVEVIRTDAAGTSLAKDAIAASGVTIFHSVGGFAAGLLSTAPASTLKVWSGWGGDYYGSSFSPTWGLLSPLTDRYRRSQSTLRWRIGRMRRVHRESRPLEPAARAADVFSAPIPSDFEVFRRRFRGFAGRYGQINYASVEDSFAPAAGAPSGDDILVGNSATLANNHLDVLAALSRAGTTGRRVVVPLSYGDQTYADAVVRRGHELFGSDFLPLRDFLPLEEYREIVANCGVVAMGHRRQQAVGNIGVGLWSGARVVLADQSPLVPFLRGRGAEVLTLREIVRSGIPHGRMAPQQLEACRDALLSFWGRARVLANAAALVGAEWD